MLAYSSISHAGFMLIAIAANNPLGARRLLYYLIPYCAMSVGAFAVVAARERELNRPVTFDNLAGFGWERPLLGVSMVAFMLGFAGFPLTAASSASSTSSPPRTSTVDVARDRRRRRDGVSLYYYLGVIRAMYFRPPRSSSSLRWPAARLRPSAHCKPRSRRRSSSPWARSSPSSR
jgi:NADH-quinone oxidoreductase subunit N